MKFTSKRVEGQEGVEIVLNHFFKYKGKAKEAIVAQHYHNKEEVDDEVKRELTQSMNTLLNSTK